MNYLGYSRITAKSTSEYNQKKKEREKKTRQTEKIKKISAIFVNGVPLSCDFQGVLLKS